MPDDDVDVSEGEAKLVTLEEGVSLEASNMQATFDSDFSAPWCTRAGLGSARS